jgi:hypothetical protein
MREDEGEEQEEEDTPSCACSDIPRITEIIHTRCTWGCEDHHHVCSSCQEPPEDPDDPSDSELIKFLVRESNKYESVADAMEACKRQRVDM